jgi:hypothetical protein
VSEAIAGYASSTARVYRQTARESPPFNGGCKIAIPVGQLHAVNNGRRVEHGF